MKKLFLILFIFLTISVNAQITSTKVVRVKNNSTVFTSGIASSVLIVDETTGKVYVALNPLPPTATIISSGANILRVSITATEITNIANNTDSITTYNTRILGNKSDIALRLKIADTASMLNPYMVYADTNAMLSPYLLVKDTTSMLSPYGNWITTNSGNIATNASGITNNSTRITNDSTSTADTLVVHRTAINLNTAKVTFPGFGTLLSDYSFTDNSANWNTAYDSISPYNTRILANKSSSATNATNITTNTSNIVINATKDTIQDDTLAAHNTRILTNVTAISLNTAKVTFPGFGTLLSDYSFTDNSANWNTAYDSISPYNTRILANKSSSATNATSIGTNAGNISTNATNIATNATNIQKNVDSLAVHLSTMQSLNINIQINAGNIATNTTNVQKNTDSIAALRADVNSLGSSKVERFTAIQGQVNFFLSSKLTLGNLVFVNGNLADVSTYSGVGTDTLTFNTPLSLYDHVTAFYAYGSSTSIYWYGVEWDTTVADPALTRIGNTEYQATLPIQSRMVRAVVNDNGTINYYLDPNNSNNKADGTAADLTGASGQVMVIIPTHWYRFEKIGTKRRVEIATVALPGFTEVPEYAVGAYEAYYNATSGKLESRSGVMATTSKTRANFRAYAAARGANWHQLDYTNYLDIFYLYLTEYATFDIQSVIPGATNAVAADWSAYNGYSPVIATGVSNTYGNYSGSVPFSLTNFVGGTGTLNSQVADYRGIENIYGHIWKFIDGINVDYVSTTQANVYTDADPSTFADDTQTGYTLLGTAPNASGWVRSLIDGSWIPATDVGASSSTYMTDYHYVSVTQTGVWRVALAGGSFSNGASSGLLNSRFTYSSGFVAAAVGARLCLKIK